MEFASLPTSLAIPWAFIFSIAYKGSEPRYYWMFTDALSTKLLYPTLQLPYPEGSRVGAVRECQQSPPRDTQSVARAALTGQD